MEEPMRTLLQEPRAPRRRIALRSFFGVGLLLLLSSASAQYAFNTPGDDHEENSIHYFGSAKDDKGALLADVTFRLDAKTASFVFVTDAEGEISRCLTVGHSIGRRAGKMLEGWV